MPSTTRLIERLRADSTRWWTLAVLLTIAVGAGLRVWGASIGGPVADVRAYREHVEIAVRNGANIYESNVSFPYLPGWLYVEELIWHLSFALHIEFWWLIRLVIVAADLLACFAVWWVASLVGGPARGRWAAAIYALSPIAILISGDHGQFDAMPTLFSVLAAGFVLRPKQRLWAAGLLLGIAIALKPSPVLLLPAFLLYPSFSWRDRLWIAFGAGIVPLVIAAPYLLSNFGAVYHNIAGYEGLNDQGLGGLLRSLWMDHNHNLYLPGTFGEDSIASSKFIVFGLIGFVLVVLWRQSLARTCAALYVAFLAVFCGASTQYLVWPLAWLLISDVPLPWAVVYSIGTAAGALGFYWVFWPQLISSMPDGTAPIIGRSSYFVVGEVVALVAIWVTFIAILWPGIKLHRWRNLVQWAALAIVLVAFYPLLNNLHWFVTHWNKA